MCCLHKWESQTITSSILLFVRGCIFFTFLLLFGSVICVYVCVSLCLLSIVECCLLWENQHEAIKYNKKWKWNVILAVGEWAVNKWKSNSFAVTMRLCYLCFVLYFVLWLLFRRLHSLPIELWIVNNVALLFATQKCKTLVRTECLMQLIDFGVFLVNLSGLYLYVPIYAFVSTVWLKTTNVNQSGLLDHSKLILEVVAFVSFDIYTMCIVSSMYLNLQVLFIRCHHSICRNKTESSLHSRAKIF